MIENMDASKLKKDSLKKFGYSASATSRARHTALNRAIESYGKESVIKKLNAVFVLTKNENPSLAKIYAADEVYVREK